MSGATAAAHIGSSSWYASVPDHALTQVEDALAAQLSAYAGLAGVTVTVAESLDIAVEDTALPALLIATRAYDFEVADENWQTLHTATLEIEAITATQSTGTITRANRNYLAHTLAAIAADRSLGIGLQDIQETDIAPADPRGKDVDGASLQFVVQFFTPRDDWFTIV